MDDILSSRGAWPVALEPQSRFIHKKFGIDFANQLELSSPGSRESIRLPGEDIGRIKAALESFGTIQLGAKEERLLAFVIPPDQFPDKGRRRVFEIHHQTGYQPPLTTYVYLYR
jgi:hypothetical protein